jgi:hypothetical protein
MKKTPRRRVDVNVEELDRIIDSGMSVPLSEADSQKLKTALHALVDRLRSQAKAEKTSAVFGKQENHAAEETPDKEKSSGHGRNGAAEKVGVKHQKLAHGESTSRAR